MKRLVQLATNPNVCTFLHLSAATANGILYFQQHQAAHLVLCAATMAFGIANATFSFAHYLEKYTYR